MDLALMLPAGARTVDVGVLDRRRGGGQVHLVRARAPHHVHDLRHRRAAHDRVVHEQHALAREHGGHGVELAAHGDFARVLVRHDEGAPHVAVLDEALAVGQLQRGGELDGGGARAVRHRHDAVDVPLALAHALRELAAQRELELIPAHAHQAVSLGQPLRFSVNGHGMCAIHCGLARCDISARARKGHMHGGDSKR